jgi:filamentous hemagglutinin family protein
VFSVFNLIKMLYQSLSKILLLLISLPTFAEVTLDGTLGPSGPLPGPDYQIGADLGEQQGSNLFHSFQSFNLQSDESAHFSGPDQIKNIFSRVTGGQPSHIDGLIRSTMPDADMYFLNPSGILFGPQARLDVQGSFHASTADTLYLQDGGQFNAREPSNSLLTVAPLEAFGFLTQVPASISTKESQLSVPETQTLSLIGGNLHLTGQSPIPFDEQGFVAIGGDSTLSAEFGRINLASVASSGQVIPTGSGLDIKAKGGVITANNTLLDVSGRGGGSVFIRGGQFVMQDAVIQANTLADQKGQGIDMQLSESIKISGETQAILSKTFGSGDAGPLLIATPHLEVMRSGLKTDSIASGRAGDIDIEVKQIVLKEGGSIACDTYSVGQGCDLRLKAEEKVLLSGQGQGTTAYNGLKFTDYPSRIATTSYAKGDAGKIFIVTKNLELVGGIIGAASFNEGNAGAITVEAKQGNISDGGMITTGAFFKGEGGEIDVNISDELLITGQRSGSYVTPTGLTFIENQSAIGSFSLGNSDESQAGHIFISADTLRLENNGSITAASLGESNTTAGNITIKVNALSIQEGGQINNSNAAFLGNEFFIGNGDGGNIQIIADEMSLSGFNEKAMPSGLFSNSFSAGQGGNIEIEVDNLALSEGSKIAANSQIGNAGQIRIKASTIEINGNSAISTEAQNADGGNIMIEISGRFYLQKGQLTTSVTGGKAQGGNIRIENPLFVILDKGQIKAEANAGQGGNIQITSHRFITSPCSLVSASSALGIDGEVKINSPVINMDDFLVVLPGSFVQPSMTGCDFQEIENLNTFKINLASDRAVPFFKK